jgi:peptidase M23-like protein
MPPPRVPLLIPLLLGLLAAIVLWLPPPLAVAAAAGWRWPVHGDAVSAFDYSPRHPFRAAQRRGIDIVAPVGARVRAACAGRVRFAGRVPDRGLGVTLRCGGGLVATHLGLGRLAVRRGTRVAAGAPLGVVGPAGRLRLGARHAGERFGYVDPLGLLRRPPRPRPAPAPLAPRSPRRRTTPVPLARRSPRSAPVPLAPRPRPAAVPRPDASIPPLAWAGLVLLAAGVPLGGLVRRSRRRGPAASATAPGRVR